MTDRAADVRRLQQALALDPRDRVAWHNLASAYGDLGHAAFAEEAARRALALGIKAPETHLVLARALQTLRRLDDAQASSRRRWRCVPAMWTPIATSRS